MATKRQLVPGSRVSSRHRLILADRGTKVTIKLEEVPVQVKIWAGKPGGRSVLGAKKKVQLSGSWGKGRRNNSRTDRGEVREMLAVGSSMEKRTLYIAEKLRVSDVKRNAATKEKERGLKSIQRAVVRMARKAGGGTTERARSAAVQSSNKKNQRETIVGKAGT